MKTQEKHGLLEECFQKVGKKFQANLEEYEIDDLDRTLSVLCRATKRK